MSRATVFVLAAVLALAGCGKKEQATVNAAKAPEPMAVRTALAEARTVERAIMVTGSLHPDESVTVSSEVAGRVKSVSADFGTSVRKGQVVAELDPLELSLQLERAKATLAQALARLGLQPGQEDAKPEMTPAMRQARAQLEDAKSKFDRAAQLVKTGDIALERYVEVEKALQARQAAYDLVRDDMLTQLATIRAMKAETQLAEKRLRDATVVAPFDGAVTQKHVSPGQYIKENVAIFTVVKTNPLRLRVEVPESAVADVKVGTALRFTTEATPGQEFQAVVRETNPSLDPKSRTLTAEALVPNPNERLKAGAFVQVKLVASKAEPVIAIPRNAVYTVAGLNKFFSIEDGKAKEHKIGEVLGANGFVEIAAGAIPPGTQVAVSNVAKLTDGLPVTVTGTSAVQK